MLEKPEDPELNLDDVITDEQDGPADGETPEQKCKRENAGKAGKCSSTGDFTPDI